MDFVVLKHTARKNLLLSSQEARPVERMPLYYRGEKVAFVFDSIGKVSSPLYLARPEGEAPENLVGKTLRSNR